MQNLATSPVRRDGDTSPEIPSISMSLLDRYGPLMTLQQLADLLGRSVAGVRFGLNTVSETSTLLAPAKLKIGRRIYFKTAVIGDVIDSLGATP